MCRTAPSRLIDTNALQQKETIEVGEWPYWAALSPNGEALFITNQDDNSVSVVDTTTLRTVAEIAVGETPEGIDITPHGRHVYVANWGEGPLSIIDVNSLAVLITVRTGKGSRAFGDFYVDTDSIPLSLPLAGRTGLRQ
jgi:YVTN family beta-propeller protein